jgi:hypothetical protein
MHNWPEHEFSSNDARTLYPKLWAKIGERYPDWTDYLRASVISLVIGTCSYCYADNRQCQCWNDE